MLFLDNLFSFEWLVRLGIRTRISLFLFCTLLLPLALIPVSPQVFRDTADHWLRNVCISPFLFSLFSLPTEPCLSSHPSPLMSSFLLRSNLCLESSHYDLAILLTYWVLDQTNWEQALVKSMNCVLGNNTSLKEPLHQVVLKPLIPGCVY